MNKLSNLGQRFIIAVLGAAFMITAIASHVYSYIGLFLLLLWLTQWEFYRLVKAGNLRPLARWGLLTGTAVYIQVLAMYHFQEASKWTLVLIPLLFLTFIIKLFDVHDTGRAFDGVAYTLLGVLYVAAPISMLHVIAFDEAGQYHYQPILGIVLMIWANDTGAYFVGRRFGKHPLFPRVSPNKTWEGFFGGGALALLMALGLSYFATDLLPGQWILVWAVLVVPASLGDLVESLLKRGLMQKDSSQSLPGHGGFLDRFDGFLMAAPFLMILWELMGW